MKLKLFEKKAVSIAFYVQRLEKELQSLEEGAALGNVFCAQGALSLGAIVENFRALAKNELLKEHALNLRSHAFSLFLADIHTQCKTALAKRDSGQVMHDFDAINHRLITRSIEAGLAPSDFVFTTTAKRRNDAALQSQNEAAAQEARVPKKPSGSAPGF